MKIVVWGYLLFHLFCGSTVGLQCVNFCLQQSDSVIHTFFFVFFPIMVYHRILNIVPCATQEDLVAYPFHIMVCLCWSQAPSPSVLFTLGNHKSVLRVCYRYVHLGCILDSVCKWPHMVFVFLSNLRHSVWQSLGPSMPPHNGITSLMSVAQEYSTVCVCTTYSLSIHLSMDIYILPLSWQVGRVLLPT